MWPASFRLPGTIPVVTARVRLRLTLTPTVSTHLSAIHAIGFCILTVIATLVSYLIVHRVVVNHVIPGIPAVADGLLVVPAPERCVLLFVNRIAQIRLVIVYDDFVQAIQVVPVIPGGQYRRRNPATTVEVNPLLLRYIIINVQIGQVIIIHIVVTGWPPDGLAADVDIDADLGIPHSVQPRTRQ